MFASLALHTRRMVSRLLGRHRTPLERALPFWCCTMALRHPAIDAHVRPYTMTSPERVMALCQAIAYLEAKRIPGAVVECGVWKGGSMMGAALALRSLASTSRPLFLFDTFTGMPPPGPADCDLHNRPAAEWLEEPTWAGDMVRARCGFDAVKDALASTQYPFDKIHFVPGRVEDTVPGHAPEQIALLRLDTDWYESTAHELEHLWPRLADGAVLIVDDYGHWQGAKRAVDEFFARHRLDLTLHVIDYTGRLVVKR
jgi:hypothetical protein